jgi:phage terminase small subunit
MTQLVRINERQKLFAELYVLDPQVGGNGTKACIGAGFAADCAAQTAYRLLRHPGVRAEIEKLTRQALGDHAVAAAAFLGKVVNDTNAPIRSRVDAAKIILDRAGFAPKEREPADPDDKDFSELSMADIERVIKKLEREIDEARKGVIDITPTDSPIADSQVSDQSLRALPVPLAS